MITLENALEDDKIMSKLLFIGTGDGIRKAKKIIRKKMMPEELKFI